MTESMQPAIPRFTRGAWESGEIVTRLGGGGIGGKAAGLWRLKSELLGLLDPLEFPGIRVTVPRMVVLGTDVFDAFMDLNDLRALALSGAVGRPPVPRLPQGRPAARDPGRPARLHHPGHGPAGGSLVQPAGGRAGPSLRRASTPPR